MQMRLIILLCASVLAGACHLFTDPGPQSLRVRNVGTLPLSQLVVSLPGAQVEFGQVAAGSTTEYQTVPGGVYHYAAYQFLHADTTATQPVIDWVGEEPMKGRHFTYELALTILPDGRPWVQLTNVARD